MEAMMEFVRKLMRNRPILAQFMAYLLLPLTALIGIWYLAIYASLPDAVTRLQMPSLQSNVVIERDEFGIPTITGSSDEEVFHALGYTHAQDRMWQMDYKRRLAKGELSKVFGKRSIQSDKFMLTLGIYEAAVEAELYLSEQSLRALDAYVDGINHWIDETQWWRRPLEYWLYDIEPTNWTRADSLAQIKLLSLSLGANYSHELLNRELLAQLGTERFNQLFMGEHDAAIAGKLSQLSNNCDSQCIDTASKMLNLSDELGLGKPGIGSNAWVISGNFTSSGKPHLANDPHLLLSSPSIFYIADLKGSELDVKGATIPGLPMVVFGQNQHIAWGATNVAADVQDLFVEQTNPLDRNAYMHSGQFQPFSVQYKEIEVASDFPEFLSPKYNPVKWPVRTSVNGPVISDVANSQSEVYALRWTALDKDDTSFNAFMRLNYASNWQEFNAALAEHVAPVLSFVYADTNNNIGIKMAGRIPVRSAANGLIPVSGARETGKWIDTLDSEQLPVKYNPREGIIVSANQRFYDNSLGAVLSNNWRPGYRAKTIEHKITKYLKQDGVIGVQDSVELQRDVTDSQALEMLRFLQELEPQSPEHKQLLDLFAGWKGVMAGDSGAAVAYQSWIRHFSREVVGDEVLNGVVEPGLHRRLTLQAEVIRPTFVNSVIYGELSKWCDRIDSDEIETCHDIARIALDATYKELRPEIGPNPQEWALEDILTSEYSHRPFSSLQFLSLIFNTEAESQGSLFTVDVAGSRYVKGEGFTKFLGATYRQVVDLADPNCHFMRLDLGQSGRLVSPNYADMLNNNELSAHGEKSCQ